MKPWEYRPDLGDYTYEAEDEPESWEDNLVSNTLAWVSDTFWPSACKGADHWTVRLVLYLWADCACCLFFRGVTFGATLGLATGLVVHIAL